VANIQMLSTQCGKPAKTRRPFQLQEQAVYNVRMICS